LSNEEVMVILSKYAVWSLFRLNYLYLPDKTVGIRI